MLKTRDNCSILVFQTRTDDSFLHEQKCILRHIPLQTHQVRFVNFFDRAFDESILQNIDGVIIGGSGQCTISRNEPEFLSDMEMFVRRIVDRHVPVFGICYGAHLLARAFGGTVECMMKNKETGSFEIHRLFPAVRDPLFVDMPEHFWANCGRTDDIIQLPMTAVPLANSDRVQYHAFKIVGKPAYGVQFHPELDRQAQEERMRMSFQCGHYFRDSDDLESQIVALHETPEASSLLTRFIDAIVLTS